MVENTHHDRLRGDHKIAGSKQNSIFRGTAGRMIDGTMVDYRAVQCRTDTVACMNAKAPTAIEPVLDAVQPAVPFHFHSTWEHSTV
nr:hypothetical protein CFP56_68678 [Quercus suber]